MKNMFKLLGFIVIIAMFNACFSPWAGDPGFITINFGEYEPEEYRNAARSAVTPEEVPYLTHIITLYGNGTPVTARLQGAGTISITALPGDWYIRVRAEHSERGQTLRALGFGQVRVVAGRQANVVIDMISATEVTNHAELAAAISSARTDGLEKIIIVTEDMYVASQLTIGTNRHIIIASDDDVIIRRGAGFNPATEMFIMQGNATLRLDKQGINGSVYVQGATGAILPPLTPPADAPPPEPTPPPVPPTSIAMEWVPGGTLQQGLELGNAGAGNTYPVTPVTLTGFYIGRYPVTQGQFYAVMGFYPTGMPTSNPFGDIQERRPVSHVSWFEAIVFSNRLSIMSGLTPAYEIPAIGGGWTTDPDQWGAIPTGVDERWNAVQIVPNSNGYRLPTEAQWEFAAKGGGQSQSPFTFSGSNTLDDVAWHNGNSGGMTRQVGLRSPNVLGIHDMSGNVFEWMWDLQGASRVMRGGAWNGGPNNTRLVYRSNNNPAGRFDGIGFRVSRPAP